MKSTILKNLVIATLTSFTIFACGKKEEAEEQMKKAVVEIKNGPNDLGPDVHFADQRVFGTWLMFEENMINLTTGRQDPNSKMRITMTLKKDRFTAASEGIDNGKVVCRAEASTTNFSISKGVISLKESLSKSTQVDAKNKCDVTIEKGELSYTVISDKEMNLERSGAPLLTTRKITN